MESLSPSQRRALRVTLTILRNLGLFALCAMGFLIALGTRFNHEQVLKESHHPVLEAAGILTGLGLLVAFFLRRRWPVPITVVSALASVLAALDTTGHDDVAILAYSAKYASAYFGPFREAVGSTLTGDRRAYQQDPANRREGMREVMLDVAEGADIVMVKPAGPYLDVLADVAAASPVPVAAYQVSGEYAMVEAAAQRGWIDRERVIAESVLGIVRAGADMVLTYWAREIAENPALR